MGDPPPPKHSLKETLWHDRTESIGGWPTDKDLGQSLEKPQPRALRGTVVAKGGTIIERGTMKGGTSTKNYGQGGTLDLDEIQTLEMDVKLYFKKHCPVEDKGK